MKNKENIGSDKDSRAKGWFRSRAQDFLVSQRLPSYETTGYYGLTLRQIGDDWVLQWEGDNRWQNMKTKIDLFGDRQLRKFDYHFARDPLKLLIRRPTYFVETLKTAPKANRGSAEEVWNEIMRLGLEEVYQPYRKGQEITGIKIHKDIAENSPTLWDIIVAQRGDLHAEKLQQIDRFDAYQKAARYKANLDLHQGYSNIDGPWEVFFRKIAGGKVEDPVANIPNIIANRSKVTPGDYHALTLARFMVNIIVEELKMPDGDPQRAAQAIVAGYKNREIVRHVVGYIKTGRLTLPGDRPSQFVKSSEIPPLRKLIKSVGFSAALRIKTSNIFSEDNLFNRAVRRLGSIHNKASMRVNPKDSSEIRETIINSCETYLDNQKTAL